jgi:2-methylfumaryl-CoA isomerase
VVAAPDTRANPMMGLVDQPGVGRYLAPASPIRDRAAGDGAQQPVRAPVLGEHSADILRGDLGLSEDDVQDLHKRGVVASAPPAR